MALSWMVFVDGENFTIRGQEFAKKHGGTLRPNGSWDKDVFLWLPLDPLHHLFDIARQDARLDVDYMPVRAHYYTSVRGDDGRVTAVREALRQLGFHPSVFKKTSDGRSKGVDITLARDFLSHAYLGNFEVALLMTGDGDFLPLVEEAQRRGRVVAVASFGETTNPELRIAADRFVDVSVRFAHAWRAVLGGGSFPDFP